MNPIKIYGDLRSGNCLKIKYTCDYLKIAYEWIAVDVMKGESHTPEFLKKNRAGQVPVIETSDGRYLAQSNAIIKYLAKDSSLQPTDDFLNAKVDEWLFWEQYSHEPAIAVLRFKILFLKKQIAEIDQTLIDKCYKALGLMEKHLSENTFLVGNQFSIADISLLAYTRLASDAHLDLKNYPAVLKWIKACEKILAINS